MRISNSAMVMIMTTIALLFTVIANAQTITGKVIDSTTLKPLADASVYVANTTIGTKTDQEGNYKFTNISAGRHQLLISCLGYQTKQVDVPAAVNEQIINIKLSPRAINLKEVTINADSWKRNLALFNREFIGLVKPQDCRIINPEILNLSFDRPTNRLSATTDDFLDIENDVLGYKLRFLVKNFWADYNTGKLHYSGTVIFQELAGKTSDQKRWLKNRANAYSGSFRHFLVSLSHNQLTHDKFIVKRLTKTVNPQWKIDSAATRDNRQAAAHQFNVSGRQLIMSATFKTPKTIETLDKTPLTEGEIVQPGPAPNTYQLQFAGYLYAIYKNKAVDADIDDLYRQNEARNYQIAAISMKAPNHPILFTETGLLLTPESLFFEGAWNSRIVDLLPNDYIPPFAKK